MNRGRDPIGSLPFYTYLPIFGASGPQVVANTHPYTILFVQGYYIIIDIIDAEDDAYANHNNRSVSHHFSPVLEHKHVSSV